jgi:hypothetical protein
MTLARRNIRSGVCVLTLSSGSKQSGYISSMVNTVAGQKANWAAYLSPRGTE